jgi:hypothetical protein
MLFSFRNVQRKVKERHYTGVILADKLVVVNVEVQNIGKK